MINCSIINVGSELLAGRGGRSGRIASEMFTSDGFSVKSILTVGDNAGQIKETVKSLLDADTRVILIIGGLGFTSDDITLTAVSKALGRKLKFSRKAMENTAAYFAAKEMEVPSAADAQANILEGAEVLKNIYGSCPGEILELENNKVIILLPGPPEEVRYLINKKVKRYLKEKYPNVINKTKILHITGLCESIIGKEVRDILDTECSLEGPELHYGFESKTGTVDLTLSVCGRDEILADEIMHKLVREIYDKISDNIYGVNGETFAQVIGKLLARKRAALAVAESCTGGLLSSVITDAPGSSIYFKYGIVAYSNTAKKNQLNIDAGLLKDGGAVSEEVAGLMAKNIMEISGSGYGLAVTGYVGPSGGKNEKAGTGFVSLAFPGGVRTVKKTFTGSRKTVKEYFVHAALDLIWVELKKE
ncbi:MAG: nicotinamide-nucleotide amidohydrolase family protein [Elusimicrobia bacterium]|jgi:nicotinamide-nucleotide amidase|nr:nicotinamide-nucleotide amidohydrolase family protein [Elusimicrobiota bacterium]